MSNYPDDFKGTNMDKREDTEQQDMMEKMFRQRKSPITVADTVGNPTADMSPFGAALFNCFKSSDRNEQLKAMQELVDNHERS